jgi:hypothetical protein
MKFRILTPVFRAPRLRTSDRPPAIALTTGLARKLISTQNRH